jgi:prephenate dehydratase
MSIFCPGGANSQSGAAVIERYPGIAIVDCGKIPDVLPLLAQNDGPYVIPIWNSHQGEVRAAEYLWNQIQEAKIKITDMWPKRIEFWFVRRAGAVTNYKKIGSVVVAKTQCSGFLAKQACELIECALTTVAHAEYRNGAHWDGVLVAPGQGENETGYEVAERKTANPNNFTSFVRFVPSRAFQTNDITTQSCLTGVVMPSFGATLNNLVSSFFEEMLVDVTDISQVPKLVVVLKRIANVGLIFEGPQLHAGDLLDSEEEEGGEISVYENAGVIDRPYSDELRDLFTQEFPDLGSTDFILHQGVNTCLFACPPLGLYTHGYETETVEPAVRFYISRLFKCIEEDAKCTPDQRAFFERHKNAWMKTQSKFMQFKLVSPTAD